MNISELIVGDRVLVQSGRELKEHAQIMNINKENGLVLVRLSDGVVAEMHPQYILKSFGR